MATSKKAAKSSPKTKIRDLKPSKNPRGGFTAGTAEVSLPSTPPIANAGAGNSISGWNVKKVAQA